MEKSDLLKTFNNQLSELFEDIIRIFPNDKEIYLAYTSLTTLKKMNPKLIINVWKKYIMDTYNNEIENGNIDYFLHKNYTDDLKHTEYANEILSKIEKIREPIKSLTDENKTKTIQYIQNLTNLCKFYYM